MSTEQEDLDQIHDAAALWMAEAEEGLSPGRQREFDRWQQADPRHAAAVKKLRWGKSLLQKMPQIREELQPVIDFPAVNRAQVDAPLRPPTRWFRVLAGCAAALVLGAVAWWSWPGQPAAQVRYACDAGGYQRVVLNDGSQLELNENSAVLVRLQPQVRHITLESGEAHFSVAKDARRPFVVEAKGVAVRAVGTAFRVRIEPASVDVLVTEGKVAVTDADLQDAKMPTGPEAAQSRRDIMVDVSAGEQTRILTGNGERPLTVPRPTVEKVTAEGMRRALEWQEKKLFFAEVPMREVVAQFNRRNRLQLVIGDPQLASRPVGGTFAADNVEGFVRLLENSGTVTTDRRGEFEIVLHSRQNPSR